MMLRSIDPRNLHEHWMFVRQGLLHCIHKGGGTYLPEDVYHLLKLGQVTLFLIGEPKTGFVILQRQEDPSGPILFVWALWLHPGTGEKVEAEIYRALDAKAYEIGASRHRMYSARRGWERCGWRATQTIYERGVEGIKQ